MKKILLLSLLPFLSYAQPQIGGDIDGEAADDGSGYSVSLSNDGTILAISALGNDGNGTSSGHVRVYKNIANAWTQIGQDIDGETADDWSGTSVSLSGDGTTLAIGTIYNSGNFFESGNVRVYKNIENIWTQIGTDIDGEDVTDHFGSSVSLSDDGTVLAIGATGGIFSINLSGSVKVYQNISNVWTQIGTKINGENNHDNSGCSVSLSGNGTILAIGAYLNDGLNGTNSGHVRIYKNIANVWTQIGQDIDGEAANDNSGQSISLNNDGSILAIGARNNDENGTNSGHVRVYKNIANAWTQIGQDIDGEASNNQSGRSVSLSQDGNILAIGAHSNNENTDPGYVRIYKNINDVWTQVGQDINGEAIGDLSGNSVSLSNDGIILAIGANFNDGINGINSGHVRVYDLSYVLMSDSFVKSNFLIYPNPTSENITIDLQNSLELQKVNFYNTLGQFIKTSKKVTINVSELSKGTYFIEVITNQGKATKSIVIE